MNICRDICGSYTAVHASGCLIFTTFTSENPNARLSDQPVTPEATHSLRQPGLADSAGFMRHALVLIIAVFGTTLSLT
jgi:hypothetical protein